MCFSGLSRPTDGSQCHSVRDKTEYNSDEKQHDSETNALIEPARALQKQ